MDVDIAVLGGPADEHHRRARLVPGRRAGRRDPRPATRQRHDQAADDTQCQAAPRPVGFDISKRVMLLSSGARWSAAEAQPSAADPEKYFEEAPMSATSPAPLSYDVFVSDGPAGAGDERIPDGAPLAWLPL